MPDIFRELERRLTKEGLGQRLRLQVERAASLYGGRGRDRIHLENGERIFDVLRFILKMSGLFARGQANVTAYEVVCRDFPLPTGMTAFDGFRVLHLSDIHADGIPDAGKQLCSLLRSLEFDLCVMTGDFRFATSGDAAACIACMRHIIDACSCRHGCCGVLGNHDFVEMAPPLEDAGLRLLLNEALSIDRDGQVFRVVGVDDPHLYGAWDLGRALPARTHPDAVLLLAHSPEIYREAAARGVDYYLCGHTHGGQICLPGGVPLLLNVSVPRQYAVGDWRHGSMQGYTARGTGASGLAVRYFCPPEVTLHTFRTPVRCETNPGQGGTDEC